MKKQCIYRKVPQWNAAFRITIDCCYEKVVFEGDEIGVAASMDKDGMLIGILECCICDPELEIIAIGATEYNAIVRDVNNRRAA